MTEEKRYQNLFKLNLLGAFLFNRGIGKDESQLNAKRIILTNTTIWIAMILSFLFSFFQNLYPVNLVFGFFGCLYFIAWWINKPDRNTITKTLLNAIVLFETISLSFAFGPNIDFEGFFIPSAIIPFLIFNRKERKLFYFSLVLTISNIMAVYTLHLNADTALVSIPENFYASLNLLFSLISINSMILLAFLFMSITELGEKLLLEKSILLEQKNVELEKLNVVKDRFLSIIAHDLKSPIHNLQGISDLILHNTLSKTESEFIINRFKISAKNTSDMLDNLLLWCNSELSNTTKKSELINLNDFIDKIFEQISYRATQKEIVLLNDVEKDIIIKNDPYAFEIVMRNIILNAIKFSHPSQEVCIRSEVTSDNVKIHVIDKGIGIPPSILKVLFDTDISKSRSGTKNEKGFGLGLTLCKQLLEQNNGAISAQSIPDQSTTLTITLGKNSAER